MAKTIGTYSWAQLFNPTKSNFGKSSNDPDFFDTDANCFPSGGRGGSSDLECCQDNAQKGPFYQFNLNTKQCCSNGQVEKLGNMC